MEFAKAAPILIDPDSPSNAKDPQPDIRSTINGEEYWFELGQIVDNILAERTSASRRMRPESFSYSQEQPLVRMVREKAAKHYETNGRPVDLVLHFSWQIPDYPALESQIQRHAATLADCVKRGPFAQVWIYDGWSRQVLWKGSKLV